jgi:hypothetical protein
MGSPTLRRPTIFAARPSRPELEASYQSDLFEYLIEEIAAR